MNEPQDQKQGREGDTGYNNPSRVPSKSRRLKEEEISNFDREPELSDPLPGDASRERSLAAVRALRKIRRIYRNALGLLILAVAVLGLFVYSAALNFISEVSRYPLYLQLPVWILLGLVLFLVVYSLVRLLLLWRSLLAQPQLSLQQVDEVERERARKELAAYLKGLVKDPDRLLERWRALSPPGSERPVELLKACRKLASDRHIEAEAWLEEFELHVIRPMDTIAAERIRYYWKLVGIKTAISPFPLVDSMAVLYNNFLLIGDLAALYGRRIGRQEILLLLGVIIFQVYVATQSQEIFDSVAEDMTQTIHSGLARSFTQFISPKLAEGTVHAMVTWRIGRRAIRMMHPLKEGKVSAIR